LNFTAKSIIRTSIVAHNSPKLVKNAIVLKDKKKDCKLIFARMAIHYTKGQKSFYKLFFVVIDALCANSKEKVIIWRCPNIK
jgi:hypothetical protein